MRLSDLDLDDLMPRPKVTHSDMLVIAKAYERGGEEEAARTAQRLGITATDLAEALATYEPDKET